MANLIPKKPRAPSGEPKRRRNGRRRRGPLAKAGIPTPPESQHVGNEAALQEESQTRLPPAGFRARH